MLWRIILSFPRLCSSTRQIVYALRTRTPLVSGIATLLPFDLHVLGLPLAFILSQDQTLHCKRVDFLTKKEIIIMICLDYLICYFYVSYLYFKELF